MGISMVGEKIEIDKKCLSKKTHHLTHLPRNDQKKDNLTLNDETDAIIKLESNEKTAYEYLLSVK